MKQTKTIEYIDYHELVDVINSKNNIYMRDYYGKFKNYDPKSVKPYCDYWHFMIDFLGEVDNGMYVEIDFVEVLEFIEENRPEEEWLIEVTKMFIAEVGEGSNTYLIEW